jgi:UDP-3-O-[3-hydroxymyristoyl] glucosamine N-acyltransferase
LVDDPEMAFVACLHHLYPVKVQRVVRSPQAQVDPTAILGEGVSIGPFATIGARTRIGKNCRIQAGCHIGDDVTLGENCVLYPNVVLYDDVHLGDNVIIHAGAVIGTDGFGYKFRNGEHVKFPQVGTVVIEANVEIGANTCIDRAALGATRVGVGTKIDNLVQIGHNVQIGARVLLCGQSGVSGSTVIKDLATLAAQAGVADHVTIGTQAIVFAQSGVTKDVADKDQVIGFPAANRKQALREMAALRRLAGHQKAVEELVRLLPTLRDMAAGD